MPIISEFLTEAIPRYHSPTNGRNAAVLIIDEDNQKCFLESNNDFELRKKSQSRILKFCRDKGLLIVRVHEHKKNKAEHLDKLSDENTIHCIKKSGNVLDKTTTPNLEPILTRNKISTLVVMGKYIDICIRFSLFGYSNSYSNPQGLLSKYSVLTSPSLLGPYDHENTKLNNYNQNLLRQSSCAQLNIYSKD